MSRLCAGERLTLPEILRGRYVDESRHFLLFKEHAAKMAYTQFRENLLRIANEEAKHVQWIGEKLIAVGGELPQVTPIDSDGKNSWECLVMDLDEERRCAAELMDQIIMLKSRDPEIAAGLQSILEDTARHRKEIREMLMRSDPYADQAA